MPAEARLHATVQGRVQGVGFRHFVISRARELGVSGHVRNHWNEETVEVVAEGPRAALEQLLSFLREGPRAAFVTHVSVEWLPPTGDFTRFEVRY